VSLQSIAVSVALDRPARHRRPAARILGMTQHVPRFVLTQRLTMMVNRYDVLEVAPDGSTGRLLATAQQKRLAFKEQVTFYADADRSTPLFGFKARQRLDLGAGYDVSDAQGAALGYFGKDFAQSLLRTTFHVEGPGLRATGQERSFPIALIRRFVDVPLPFHFDFRDAATGTMVMSSTKKFGLRDRYLVDVPDPRVDFRLAASVAVALDALLSR